MFKGAIKEDIAPLGIDRHGGVLKERRDQPSRFSYAYDSHVILVYILISQIYLSWDRDSCFSGFVGFT